MWVLQNTKGENMFLLSLPFLREELKIRFPELHEILIEKKYPHILKVSLKTAPVVAKWQYEILTDPALPPIKEEGFVNEKGMFFPTGNTDVLFRIEEKISRKKAPEFSEEVISQSRLQEILLGKKDLERITGQEIISAQYIRNAQEIHFVAKNKTIFWLFMNIPFEKQIQKLERSLSEFPIFSRPIEYIDLRISGKIIYKPL